MGIKEFCVGCYHYIQCIAHLDFDTRIISQKAGLRVTGQHSSACGAQATSAMWGRSGKVEAMAHVGNSVVSRCGLMGMLPSTEEACPESLLSVMLVDNAFLVDMWAPSVILLLKWSKEPLHGPWTTIPSKSASIGTTFCILARSAFSEHQFCYCPCGSTHRATPLQLQRARAACLLSMFCSWNILWHSCCCVCWFPGM